MFPGSAGRQDPALLQREAHGHNAQVLSLGADAGKLVLVVSLEADIVVAIFFSFRVCLVWCCVWARRIMDSYHSTKTSGEHLIKIYLANVIMMSYLPHFHYPVLSTLIQCCISVAGLCPSFW